MHGLAFEIFKIVFFFVPCLLSFRGDRILTDVIYIGQDDTRNFILF